MLSKYKLEMIAMCHHPFVLRPREYSPTGSVAGTLVVFPTNQPLTFSSYHFWRMSAKNSATIRGDTVVCSAWTIS